MEEDNDNTNEVICPTCSTSVYSDLLIPAGESKICPNCRDEYIQRISEGVAVNRSDEFAAIRQEHIKHEASLKSVAGLYLLSGVLIIFGSITLAFSLFAMDEIDSEMSSAMLIPVVIYVAIGVLMIVTALAFRKLRPWARIPATILSVLGLISFPIGTLINGYILYLIWSQKGKMVFTSEYQEIVEATPEIKYRTSILSWIILALLVAGLISIILFATVG